MLTDKQRISLAYGIAHFIVKEGGVEIDSGTDELIFAIRDIISRDNKIDDIVEDILFDVDISEAVANFAKYKKIFGRN